MVIHCNRCGRPLAAIDPPAFEPAKITIAKRLFPMLGAIANLEALLSPSPEGIAKMFNTRCPHGC